MKNQIRRARLRAKHERLTATQAARDFSALLDRIESGGEAVIERHSHPVAILSPAAAAPRRLSACAGMPIARPSARADAQFAKDLEAIIRGNPAAESPSWE
ncbi:MAG TPA: hypothetical protein VJN43_20530 [Bryobacteraceae bacterium]|nr:hypothetical protein [Bryobacteraceae bacterium]